MERSWFRLMSGPSGKRSCLRSAPGSNFPEGNSKPHGRGTAAKWLNAQGAIYSSRAVKAHTDTDELGARLESVNTWYEKDWMNLDPKLRTSCVEGISSFLSLFDMADVAAIFCPKAPPVKDADGTAQKPREPGEDGGKEDENADGRPPTDKARMRRHLPPLDELIESGKVLALNMPSGSNPALARAIGVFLKNAWLQTLLRRPAQMKADSERYFRPAVFICDEYQSFASVGEDDPSWGREGVCPHPAVPRHPHRRHPIHILAPIRAGHLRSLAGAFADTPHPDLPLSQRRRERRHRLETLRAGGPDQAELDRHRIRTTGPGVPALWTGRWNQGLSRHE